MTGCCLISLNSSSVSLPGLFKTSSRTPIFPMSCNNPVRYNRSHSGWLTALEDHPRQRLLAVIGGSLGGMQVLEWAARFPDTIRSAIVLASGSKLSARGIAFNAIGRRAILADPSFHDGDFYSHDEVPSVGLALARMVAHVTYLSEASIEMKFGRRLLFDRLFLGGEFQ